MADAAVNENAKKYAKQHFIIRSRLHAGLRKGTMNVRSQAADPVAEDGTVILDQARIEARQTAQAKRLLADGEFTLIVLGGAHDLSDNLDRLSGGRAEYIRVATKRWLKFGGDAGGE